MSKWKDLGTLLLEYGLISNSDIKEGLKLQKETGLRLGEALAKLGKISMEDIEWVLSKQLDVPFVIVEDITVNMDLLYRFQKEFLIDNRVLPLYETDDQISIVIEDPFNKPALDVIEKLFNKTVNISTGSGRKIDELLKNGFQKVGLPVLVGSIKNITDRIKETSFYRIDFLLDEHSCKINVFGSGILKNVKIIKGHFTNEDTFRAFDELNIPFLYEQSSGNDRRFLAVYPLLTEMNMPRLPAIIGAYGLARLEDTIFSDAHVFGLSNVFPLAEPIQGYPYFMTKKKHYKFEKCIFTIDAAPAEFNDCYINTYIPRKCTSCNGTGCEMCKELGHVFQKMEGMYSSDDLKKGLKEGEHGKD